MTISATVCRLAFSLIVSAIPLPGAVALSSVFSDHLVLQRDRPVPVWGTATPGEKVDVTFGRQHVSTVADASGRWSVTLASMAAQATPADLNAQGTTSVSVHDVLVGDVWLCSGQSNMEKPLGEKRGQKPVFHSEEELKAGNHPLIRLLKVTKNRVTEPADKITGEWTVCSPTSLEKTQFSAAGYFFGRKLQEELQVPIGLIDSTWGGTRIELWTAPTAFAVFPSLAELAAAVRTPGAKAEQTVPSSLYYGMIHPLVPYALRGVLWYQGETNLMDVNDSDRYPDKMEALIRGWREAFADPYLPFYYVQIAPHFYHLIRRQVIDAPTSLPEFWEAQAAVLRIPHTGMAVITDLVDDLFDIHPRNKQDVGLRLAWLALARTYGRKDVVDSGPVFRRWEVKDGRAYLYFDHTGGGAGGAGGLAAKDGKPLSWFVVAGEEGEFVPAQAVIEGDHVVVSSPRVQNPRRVRFAWDEAAQPNLVNGAGLPAWPFRTDRPAQVAAPPADR